MSDPVLSYSEYRDRMMHNTNFTQEQIKRLWDAVFVGEKSAPPTLRAVATLLWTIEQSSFDDVMVVLRQ